MIGVRIVMIAKIVTSLDGWCGLSDLDFNKNKGEKLVRDRSGSFVRKFPKISAAIKANVQICTAVHAAQWGSTECQKIIEGA